MRDGTTASYSALPRGGLTGIYRLTPYDLILLEYPHGFGVAPGDPIAGRLDEYFTAARLVPPRALLASGVACGEAGNQVASRGRHAQPGRARSRPHEGGFPELGKETKMPCGPATRPFADKNPAPPAPRAEAVRPILPLSAWYSGDCQANAPPVKLTFEAG